jgi:hypothetical protein
MSNAFRTAFQRVTQRLRPGVTSNADQVRFADVNGDGKADYLVIDPDGSVHVRLNNGGDGHGGWTDYGQVKTGVITT